MRDHDGAFRRWSGVHRFKEATKVAFVLAFFGIALNSLRKNEVFLWFSLPVSCFFPAPIAPRFCLPGGFSPGRYAIPAALTSLRQQTL
jgi:hypothetical protein